MFRGFRASSAQRGRVEYEFLWLWRRPLHAVFEIRSGMLSFPALFPGVGGAAEMLSVLKGLVASRAERHQPAHKRIDARRARVSCAVRNGVFSLAVHIRGANHEYAVRHALNLINELFLALQETYPDYLIERFGLSTE